MLICLTSPIYKFNKLLSEYDYQIQQLEHPPLLSTNANKQTQQTFVGLQHIFSVTILGLPRRLEDVLKTFSRPLERHLKDVFKTSWKTKNC